MIVDEQLSVTESTWTSTLNFISTQSHIPYVYPPLIGITQNQSYLNYPHTFYVYPREIMSTDFSHPPPIRAGNMIIAPTPTPAVQTYVPLSTTYITNENYTTCSESTYISTDQSTNPYSVSQPISYTRFPIQQTSSNHYPSKMNNPRHQHVFTSDTSCSVKASVVSDTSSSSDSQRNEHRRYSDPRSSTRQREHKSNEMNVVDSSSNVSKSSTIKSTGVDSVDSADSGLTADHSSPEHRTSTPTTSHISAYYQSSPIQQQLPNVASSSQTLLFHSTTSSTLRYDAPIADQPTSSANSTTTAFISSADTTGNGNSNGIGIGVLRSRSSSPAGNGEGSNASATVTPALAFPPVGPHAVYVHVNLGETLSVRVGNEIQNIPGPATVRMVSSHNAGPPVPLPLHVPPGHVVQQIVDENGTLRHLILSPQTPQPPTVTAGAPFPCVNVTNGPVGHSVLVPINGNAVPTNRGIPTPTAIPGHLPAPPNGVGPVPVAVLAPGECPPGPSYHAHQPAHPTAIVQPTPTPLMAVGPIATHAHMAPTTTARHPLHLHTNPPHICQLHIHGANVDESHLYPPGERVYAGKVMNRTSAKNSANTNSQVAGGAQRAYDYQDQDTSALHDTTMDDNTSAATSGGNEDEEICKIAEMLSRIPPPQVCDIGPRDALVQWQPFDCSEASASGGPFPQIDASEFTYEILLYERRTESKPTNNYRCQADQLQQQWLSHLKPATEYYVRLRALLEERGLYGEPSPAVAFKTKPTHPDKPQPPRVHQRSKHWLMVRWQSTCDNGAKMIGYHLEMDEGRSSGDGDFKEIYFGLAKQFKLQKLQPSTLYRIRLAASNDHGKSEYSDILLVQTAGAPPLPPDPPTLVQATSHSLTVQWKRREGDEEFELFMEDPQTGHGYLPVAVTRDVSYVVLNLTRYKEYRFRLSAVNEDGRSVASEAVVYRTLPARPHAPAKPHTKGRVSASTAKIAWETPRDTGGGETIEYILDMCNEKHGSIDRWTAVYQGPEREHHVSALEPGVTYRFRVACCSAGGRSMYSDDLSLTTSAVPPGMCRPPVLHGKAKPTSLHLKWSAPEFLGGAEISEYELMMERHPSEHEREATRTMSAYSSTVYEGPRTDMAVSIGLEPGRTYAFRVRAYNRAGAGPWSDALECETAPAPPECPQRLRVIEKTSTTVALAWDAPTSSNGATVTEYRIQAWRKSDVPCPLDSKESTVSDTPTDDRSFPSSPSKSKSSSTHVPIRQTSASSTSACVDGTDTTGSTQGEYATVSQVYVASALTYEAQALRPDTDYVFRVQAVNSAGLSRLSDPLTCRTQPGVPDAPYNLKTEVLSLAEITVSWDAPFDNGSPISGYYLDVSPPPVAQCDDTLTASASAMITLPTHSTQYTVENLEPETSYKFRVQAFNEIGAGAFSAWAKAVTFSPPPSPPLLELAMASHNSLKLRWNEAATSAVENAITYTVEMENKSGAFSPVAAELTSRSCKVPRLSEFTSYRFRIRACSITGGAGAWSDIFAFKTTRSPPPSIKSAPRISDVTENSCQIDWQAVKLTSGGCSWASNEKLHYSVQVQGPSTTSEDYRQVYKGASTSYHLSGLTQGCTYRVRVCALRVSPPDTDCAKETDTYGAPSPTCCFSTVSTTTRRKFSEHESDDAGPVEPSVEHGIVSLIRYGPGGLSDYQWAFLILMMFSLLAVLAAFLLQRFIPASGSGGQEQANYGHETR